MTAFLVYLFNVWVIIAYLFCTWVSLRALKTLEEFHDFEFRDIFEILSQGFSLAQSKSVPTRDSLGWYSLYMGAATISASSALFALMHFKYMVVGDVLAVGLQDSAYWFLIHTMNILGSIAVWFAVAKHRIGTDDE